MSKYKFSEEIRVRINETNAWNDRIYLNDGEDGGVICVVGQTAKESEKNFKSGRPYDTSWWPCHCKKQLISDEVREKLVKAVDDGINLKFRVESEEQLKEFLEFAYSLKIDKQRSSLKPSDRFLGWTYVYINSKRLGADKKSDYNEDRFKKSNNLEFSLKTGELIKPVPDWWKVGNYAYNASRFADEDKFFEIDKDDEYFDHYLPAKLVPFTYKDIDFCMVENISLVIKKNINGVCNTGVNLGYDGSFYTFDELSRSYQKLDGSPCGKFEVIED